MGILQCPAQLRLPNEAVKNIIARKKESAYNMGYMYIHVLIYRLHALLQ